MELLIIFWAFFCNCCCMLVAGEFGAIQATIDAGR